MRSVTSSGGPVHAIFPCDPHSDWRNPLSLCTYISNTHSTAPAGLKGLTIISLLFLLALPNTVLMPPSPFPLSLPFFPSHHAQTLKNRKPNRKKIDSQKGRFISLISRCRRKTTLGGGVLSVHRSELGTAVYLHSSFLVPRSSFVSALV